MKEKRLDNSFCNINPTMLDEWFADKIKKYKNSRLSEDLKMVYLMLTDDTPYDDTLSRYYEEKGWA